VDFSPYMFYFCPKNSMNKILYFIAILHKLDGIPAKDSPSLFTQALNIGFNLLMGRNA
jgi:hypothetical protein